MMGWDGTTSSLGSGCEAFDGFAGFCSLVARTCLGPTVTLDADFVVLLLLVFFTSLRVGVKWKCRGWVGIGRGVSLTTRPPTDDMVSASS